MQIFEYKSTWVVILALLLNISLLSQDVYVSSHGVIQFESDAPLELIKASSDDLRGALNFSNNEFAFIVLNRSFKGFNSPVQQEHFYENYIEDDKFPRSSFQGKIIEKIDANLRGDFNVRAKGILDIHGVKQERIIPGTLIIENDKAILSAVFKVPLKDHNIEIPRVVYQKIAEEITVEVHIELSQKTEQQ